MPQPPVTPPLFTSPPAYGTVVASPPPIATPAPATVSPAPAITSPYPTTPAPAVSPYATPAPYTAAPSLATPAPSLAPGAVSPPPPFDPYAASASPLGAPPSAVPYSLTPPPPASPEVSPLYPNGLPYQFQPPPTDSYYATAQKLLQELSAEFTWLYGKQSNPNDLGVTRVELTSTFALPMFYNVETPLLVTPGFAFNWFDGPLSDPADVPRGPDLPPRVYDAYLDFAWYPRVNQWLGAELGVRTGVYSDFDVVTTDSVRILGRGLATVSVTPNLDILFGVVYLDRVKIKLLPAGGVYWRPTPEWDAYLVFPNPKVRQLLGERRQHEVLLVRGGRVRWRLLDHRPSGRRREPCAVRSIRLQRHPRDRRHRVGNADADSRPLRGRLHLGPRAGVPLGPARRVQPQRHDHAPQRHRLLRCAA